jgi:hypothetical protein
MSRAQFVQEVEKMELSAEAKAYFAKSFKAPRVNKKEQEKAQAMKDAILAVLRESAEVLDRETIANAINDSATLPEEYLVNDKGGLAVNSITAYANQLVAEGSVKKILMKVGKAKRVHYVVA